MLLAAGAVLLLLVSYCRATDANEKFAAGIDWSTSVNDTGTLPGAKPTDIADLHQRVRTQLDNASQLADARVQAPQRVHVLARINPKDASQPVVADAAGGFYQQCRIAVGGTVTLLSEDRLTYLVTYMPPRDAQLTADDCQGHEVFFLAKISGSEG